MLDYSLGNLENLYDYNKKDLFLFKKYIEKNIKYILQKEFPNGKIKKDQFVIGNIYGDKGESLNIQIEGEKSGCWIDFATGEKGDIFHLWGLRKNISSFIEIIKDMKECFDYSENHIKRYVVEKGKKEHKWIYYNEDNEEEYIVFRKDYEKQKKDFKIFLSKEKKYGFPKNIILYNLNGIKKSDQVIFVEGEKCAQALIDINICATCLPGGSNVRLDNVDFSPLENKNIIMWPDADSAGLKFAKELSIYIKDVNVKSFKILNIKNKPEKWDCYDAIEDGLNIENFIKNCSILNIKNEKFCYSLREILLDQEPTPDDILGHRILTPGGFMLLGGGPKVGKSDLLVSWMIYAAAGIPFLGIPVKKKLKVFYYQAEIEKCYLRDRIIKTCDIIDEDILREAVDNFITTPRTKRVFTIKTIDYISKQIINVMDKPDIIVIDPLRNVFDGQDENSNVEMIKFLRDRIDYLRDSINPDAGIILLHHFTKQPTDHLFNAFAGAGSLRGYYTTGVLMLHPNIEDSTKKLMFELRNGPALKPKYIDKTGGCWYQKEDYKEEKIQKTKRSKS